MNTSSLIQKCNIKECYAKHTMTCPICLTPYCSEKHRVLDLQCGHGSWCRPLATRPNKSLGASGGQTGRIDVTACRRGGVRVVEVDSNSATEYGKNGTACDRPDIRARGKSIHSGYSGVTATHPHSPRGMCVQQAPLQPSYAPFPADCYRFIPYEMRSLVHGRNDPAAFAQDADDDGGLEQAGEVGRDIFRSMKNITEFYSPGESVIVVPVYGAGSTGLCWALLLPVNMPKRKLFLRALMDSISLNPQQGNETVSPSECSKRDRLHVVRGGKLCRAVVVHATRLRHTAMNVDQGGLFALEEASGLQRAPAEHWIPPTAMLLALLPGSPELEQPLNSLEMVWDGNGALKTKDHGCIISVLHWDEGVYMRFKGASVVPRPQLERSLHHVRLLSQHGQVVEFRLGREEDELDDLRDTLRESPRIPPEMHSNGCGFESGDMGFTDSPKYKDPRRFLVLRADKEAGYLDVAFIDDGGADSVPKKHCYMLSLALTEIPSFVNTLRIHNSMDEARLKVLDDCMGLDVFMSYPCSSQGHLNVHLCDDIFVTGTLMKNTMPVRCMYDQNCLAHLNDEGDSASRLAPVDDGAAAGFEEQAEDELVKLEPLSPATVPIESNARLVRPSGLQFRELKEGSILRCLVLGLPDIDDTWWDSGYDFAAIPVDDLSKFQATPAFMGRGAHEGLCAPMAESPKLGDVVLAKDRDGKFKRAFVGPNGKVSFVDAGNVEDVDERGGLCQIPASLMQHQAVASLFALDESEASYKSNISQIRHRFRRVFPFYFSAAGWKTNGPAKLGMLFCHYCEILLNHVPEDFQ